MCFPGIESNREVAATRPIPFYPFIIDGAPTTLDFQQIVDKLEKSPNETANRLCPAERMFL